MRSHRHLPALDGVRALAIVAVITYHLGYGWAAGGYLGVDLFFVLSGFLITSLLVERWQHEGGVGIRGFWGRRARRLMPGLLLMLVVVVAFAGKTSSGLPVDLHEIRVQALATVGYVANWQLLFSHQSYFDRFALPSPLRHTWSLAIEEQFYLVWPLVVAAVVRAGRWRRLGLGLTAGGAVASAAWMALLWHSGASVNRLYYGTDTRAFDLLVGACLAFATVGRPEPSDRARRLLGPLAWSGLGALVLIAAFAGAPSGMPRSWMFSGGLFLAALAATALLAGVRAEEPGSLGRLLSKGPLRYIGRISYGLYLWHWPVIVELTPARAHTSGLALAALRVGLTTVLAALSYAFVEQPIRRGWPRLRLAWQRLALAPGAMAATAAAVIVATVPPSVATASAGTVAVDAPTTPAVATQRASGSSTGELAGAIDGLGRATKARPLRVLLLGDSVMLSESPAVEALFGATGEADVENHSQWGFGLTALRGWQQQIPQWIADAHPELVVAMWSWDNAAFAAHPAQYRAELESFVRLVLAPGDGVRGLVFQQFPVPGPGNAQPGSPDYDARSVPLIDRFDGLEEAMAREFPGRVAYAAVGSSVTWHGRFATWLPPGGDASAPRSTWLRARQVDNVHFCPAGAARYAAALYRVVAPWVSLGAPHPGWESGAWTQNYLAYRYPDAGVCPDDHPSG